MNIGYISSDTFSPYLGTSLYSLLDNNKDIKEINIYIFDVLISENNKEKIINVARKYGRTVKFVGNVDAIKEIVEKNKLPSFGGIASTYVKIMPELFFGEIDRILILDCDTIINQNLSELYNTDIDNCIVAAVPEITAYYYSSEDPKIIYNNRFYYNTGVLLWNLKRMRETNFNTKLLSNFKEYYKPLKLADQSLFNLTVCDEDVKPVNFKYNFNNNLNYIFRNIRRVVMEQYEYMGLGIPEANYYKKIDSENIAIIHYIGDCRPWKKWRMTPLGSCFMKYWRKGPWKNTPRDSYLDQCINQKISKNPSAFAGKKYIGKIYVLLLVILERYFPEIFKKLKEMKYKLLN